MESRTPQHPQPLPDVAHEAAALARPLDWVGMEALALPIRLAGGDASPLLVPAEVDVAVDLRDAGARGIHMSRLYLLLQDQLANEPLTAPGLRRLLDACIASQQGLGLTQRGGVFGNVRAAVPVEPGGETRIEHAALPGVDVIEPEVLVPISL